MSYKGFSSQHVVNGFDTRLVGKSLIKADLENSFSIRKGEVRGRPQVGTRLHNYIGKQFDEFNRDAIMDDVKTILNSDPRISVNQMTFSSTVDTLAFTARITYTETNEQELWNIFVSHDGGVTIA